MIDFSEHEIGSYYRARVQGLRLIQGKLRAPCPIHRGKDPNFSIDQKSGRAFCHSQCARGWDIISLEMELSGLDFVKAKAEVFRMIGRPEPVWQDRDIEATYDYTDENGKMLYQVVRKAGKKFMQRRPSGSGWQWGLGNIEPVPYRLPEIVKAKPETVIAIVEGEKDCKSLVRAGWVATCNNGGAGNFKPSLAKWFKDRHVALFADNDDPGRKHVESVAKILHPVAASVRIVEIPNLPLKGDVSDFLAPGDKTGDDLYALYSQAQEYTPEWQFEHDLPHANDKYVRSLADRVHEVGGVEKFWGGLDIEGIPTPFKRVTEALGGLRKGEVYVLGANQGAGKTSLALQFGLTALLKGNGVLMYSMEMSHDNVYQRMIAIDARADLSQYRRLRRIAPGSDAAKEIHESLLTSTRRCARMPLLVTTKSAVTPDFLVTETTRLKKRSKIDLLIIDHMQLMSSDGKPRSDYEKFTAISRATKGIASELDMPVLLISQTSRANSMDKRAELEASDLRGSGALEEDAAAIFLLYYDRDDFLRAKDDGDRLARGPIKTWLKIDKNRYGMQGMYLEMLHLKTQTRFCLAEELDEPRGIDLKSIPVDEEASRWQQ